MSQIPHENYDQINASGTEPRFLQEGVDYFSVLIHCEYPGAPAGGTIQTFSGPELDEGPDPLALRAEALAQITVEDPPVSSNPPHDEPGRFGIVHIPTWFWLDDAYWQPLTATASDGGLTVTVTATPQVANWDPGDGSPAVPCFDAGTEWAPGLPETATACSYTYTSSSADHAGAEYSLEVAVEWEYTWTLNGTPQGPFGSTTVSSPFTYAVGEIQAVES